MFLLFALPVIILYGARKFIESRWGKCKNQIKLDGRIAIVTGANSGIGFAVAKELSRRHATIILACRNLDKAKTAIKKIKTNVGSNANLIPMELDLASLKSIREFVDNFKKQFRHLDILINNAGVSFCSENKREFTKDGLEIHFGVNYLGHFYLTNLLLDCLEDSRPSKVIIVSSKHHERAEIDLKDLNSTSKNGKNLYSDSKLENIYFCKELAQRVANKGIDVFAICPGWVYTNLFRHYIKWYHYIMLPPIAFFFMRSPSQGAETIIYCATEPGLETGLIYRDCKMYESKHKFDSGTSLELWNKTEEIIEECNKNSLA